VSVGTALQAGGRPFEPGTAHYAFGLQIAQIAALGRDEIELAGRQGNKQGSST
jgi:hypothetical protein